MNKQAPSFARIMTMVLFALSCFGLLVFLWVAFGGATPLRPDGYQITVPFKEAGQLAQQADVRISGVRVGTVKTIVTDPESGNSNVTVEMLPQYSPVASDSRAMLRAKSLLGETYLELTPGSPDGPFVADNGTLPRGNISSRRSSSTKSSAPSIRRRARRSVHGSSSWRSPAPGRGAISTTLSPSSRRSKSRLQVWARCSTAISLP